MEAGNGASEGWVKWLRNGGEGGWIYFEGLINKNKN